MWYFCVLFEALIQIKKIIKSVFRRKEVKQQKSKFKTTIRVSK